MRLSRLDPRLDWSPLMIELLRNSASPRKAERSKRIVGPTSRLVTGARESGKWGAALGWDHDERARALRYLAGAKC
jgi:hypothetical protein